MIDTSTLRKHADLFRFERNAERLSAADDELVVARELRENNRKIVATHEVALATARRQERKIFRVATGVVDANLFEEEVEELLI